MKTQICRCCGMNVGLLGWSNHVLKHKKEFCRAIGRFIGEAYKVNWEDVVLYCNPKEANRKKCINYPRAKNTYKTLNDFKT